MYAVSDEYARQMKKPDTMRNISGTIGGVPFTSGDIIKDTLDLSKQCSESGEIKLGSVYTAMMEATFRSGLVERETWKGLEIIISEGIYLENGETIEDVPLGKFYVDEAIHGKKGVSITAYDAMTFFEKPVELSTTYGKPYELTLLACNACGVELAMTQQAMAALPNGNKELQLYAENDMETWRDWLFWIGVTCAGFWTINRSGGLELRTFKNNPIDIIPSNLRHENASFSDFTTEYTSVAFTDVKTKKKITYGMVPDDKLTYDLGANPWIQYDNDREREEKCRNILNAIQAIAYVPFSARVQKGAPYDLGDILRFTGGRAETEKICCVMLWEYDGKGFDLEGYGSNPKTVDARSKADKDLQAVSTKVDACETVFYKFVNSGRIQVADGTSEKIIDIRFTSTKSTVVTFSAEILITIDTTVTGITYDAAQVKVIYRYNDMYLDSYVPRETYLDGSHMLHLTYPIEIQGAAANRMEVFLEMDGGSAVMNAEEVRSFISGQGLAATDVWDGTITIRQTVGRGQIGHPTKRITKVGISESVAVAFQIPTPMQLTEEIPIMEIGHPTKRIIGADIVDAAMGSWEEEKETGNIIHVINEEAE